MSNSFKPTVIKTDKDKVDAPQPTTMPSSDPKPSKVATSSPVTPTVIGGGKKEGVIFKPTIVTVKEGVQEEKGTAVAPSKIVGFERNRLPVTIEQIKRKYLNTNDLMATKALQYVVETDVEVMLHSSALIWQTDLQKRYSDKVMKLLEYTQHPATAKASNQISRILEILQSIDLQGVCEYETDGVISRFLKNSSKEFDTPEELQHAEKELKQLTYYLADQLKALLVLQQKLQEINVEIKELAAEIKAAGMAALFLADYLPGKGPQYLKIADQFLERGKSLMQTEVQIFENEVARDSQEGHPIKLIEMIQNTILVMIPDWLGSVSSIRSMVEMNKKVTVTEVEQISDWKKKIIQLLK